MDHRCPEDTHADCPDYNNFSRFLNYAPSKEALIAKVGALSPTARLLSGVEEMLSVGFTCTGLGMRPCIAIPSRISRLPAHIAQPGAGQAGQC